MRFGTEEQLRSWAKKVPDAWDRWDRIFIKEILLVAAGRIENDLSHASCYAIEEASDEIELIYRPILAAYHRFYEGRVNYWTLRKHPKKFSKHFRVMLLLLFRESL